MKGNEADILGSLASIERNKERTEQSGSSILEIHYMIRALIHRNLSELIFCLSIQRFCGLSFELQMDKC